MPPVPAAVAADLAPTGALRAAINLGNPVLAHGTAAAPAGITVEIARELASMRSAAAASPTPLWHRPSTRYAGRVDATVPIARFLSDSGVDEAAELLREHGLKCAVVESPGSSIWPLLTFADRTYRWLVVDEADEQRATTLIADLPHDPP